MNPKIFYYLNSHRIYFWLFLSFFLMQIFLWKITENIHPKFDLIPPAPNKYMVSALSFGDNEFLFRILSARLQNSGDVFAGFVALKNYNYSYLYDWMKILDNLNSQSRLIPSLASYYYSQTQNISDNKYIIKYLDEYASKDIDKHWWWLFQATYIAKINLKDLKLALQLAEKLAINEAKDAPLWTKQLPAFIREDMGEGCVAFKIIKNLIDEIESGKRIAKPEEMNFMRYFINSRLTNLKNQKFNPKEC